MEEKSPRRLLTSSGDAVMKLYPNYLYLFDELNLKNSLQLITKENIRKLSQERDLMYRVHDSKHKNVLQYLLVEDPKQGMIYGARYGMKRLFHAAKRSYLAQNDIRDRKTSDDFKKFISESVIHEAVRGSDSDLKIYNACVRYMSPEYAVNHEGYMYDAMIAENEVMIRYLISQGVSIRCALRSATSHIKLNIIKWLLRNYLQDADIDLVRRYMTECMLIAVEAGENHLKLSYYEIFKFCLGFVINDERLAYALRVAVINNRIRMVSDLLEQGARDTADASCLRSAVTVKKVEILQMLLQQFQYDTDSIVRALTIALKYNATEDVIGPLLDYLPKDPHILSALLDLASYDMNIYNYIRRKWTE